MLLLLVIVMFGRRLYVSCPVPRQMYCRLHISSQRQAFHMLPSFVPLASLCNGHSAIGKSVSMKAGVSKSLTLGALCDELTVSSTSLMLTSSLTCSSLLSLILNQLLSVSKYHFNSSVFIINGINTLTRVILYTSFLVTHKERNVNQRHFIC